MIIEHESANYAWHWDSRMGVGRFSRKADGALTLLSTGSDAAQERRDLHRLAQKTSSPRYPKAAPPFGDLFDNLASEYTYFKEGELDY